MSSASGIPAAASRFAVLRAFVGAFVLNALLVLPLTWQTYKHFSPEETPMDVSSYMAMAEGGPEAVHEPFRYRVLTPMLVRALD